MKPDAVPAMAAGFKPSLVRASTRANQTPVQYHQPRCHKGIRPKGAQPLGGNRIVRKGFLSMISRLER